MIGEMIMIKWDESCCIGIDILDEQHKELFGLCRQLELILQMPDGVDDIKDIIKLVCKFREYATFHFYTEENFMMDIDYPNIEEHKTLHKSFNKYITSLDMNSICIGKKNDLKSLLHFSYGWIFEHVQGMDRDIKNYIR